MYRMISSAILSFSEMFFFVGFPIVSGKMKDQSRGRQRYETSIPYLIISKTKQNF
ncbi:Uncharacterized protein APZ42_016723 [Daphnia magna]|uniref:Uncharacterized protein n=1 Tax=Daphnia magna TaxID=35525 RepID=A0A165A3Z0_9CRUS|nr:Uncharacterized protein APZ42_016723 [Daphnia magna]